MDLRGILCEIVNRCIVEINDGDGVTEGCSKWH
jgi:hypothetical protein